MARAHHKAKMERDVFTEFADWACLQVSDVTNCRPPAPDISFTIHGERRYCEMGRALDENLEKRMDQQKCGSAVTDISRSVCVSKSGVWNVSNAEAQARIWIGPVKRRCVRPTPTLSATRKQFP
jgi:hypothetical protein